MHEVDMKCWWFLNMYKQINYRQAVIHVETLKKTILNVVPPQKMGDIFRCSKRLHIKITAPAARLNEH